MRDIERRLRQLEARVRCPLHRQRYCCACQAQEITEEEGERFDNIIDHVGIRFEDLVPAPHPCVRCGEPQFCIGCNPKLRWATIRPQLSPEDVEWVEELLSDDDS